MITFHRTSAVSDGNLFQHQEGFPFTAKGWEAFLFLKLPCDISAGFLPPVYYLYNNELFFVDTGRILCHFTTIYTYMNKQIHYDKGKP